MSMMRTLMLATMQCWDICVRKKYGNSMEAVLRKMQLLADYCTNHLVES